MGPKEIAILFGGAIVLGTGVGAGMHFWPATANAEQDASAGRTVTFSFCAGSSDTNCVVDGDTIRLDGEKIDYDALRPILFTMDDKGYRRLGERFADAWSAGKELLKE